MKRKNRGSRDLHLGLYFRWRWETDAGGDDAGDVTKRGESCEKDSDRDAMLVVVNPLQSQVEEVLIPKQGHQAMKSAWTIFTVGAEEQRRRIFRQWRRVVADSSPSLSFWVKINIIRHSTKNQPIKWTTCWVMRYSLVESVTPKDGPRDVRRVRFNVNFAKSKLGWQWRFLKWWEWSSATADHFLKNNEDGTFRVQSNSWG